jgi:hypothetical protein
VAVLLIVVRHLHSFRNCTASMKTVYHFYHSHQPITRFAILFYNTLVIRIFRQLLSKLHRSLSEAGDWTLLLTSGLPENS